MSHTRQSRARRLGIRPLMVLALLFGTALGIGVPTVAYAASLTVTTTADELNTDGDCSLREAIRAANLNTRVDACAAGGSTDTITLREGTYALGLAGQGEDVAATGDLDIAVNLTISGAGVGKTVVDGAGIDRVFHVVGGRITIADLTIANGHPGDGDGGGVLVAAGSLRLLRSAVTGSAAQNGSGLANTATLLVERSVVSDNRDANFWGGGIANSGALTLDRSTVSGNAALESGGGIHSRGGTVWIEESVISGNEVVSGDGGGIGGGFLSDGTIITIIKSTIRDNSTHDVGGGGISGGASVTIAGSTISDNAVLGVDAVGGGGIDTPGQLVVTNSTISGNRTWGNGGGIRSVGGGSLNNVTIANNVADVDEDGGGDGGGVAVAGGAFQVANSIIAGNSAKGGGAPDCVGTIVSQGYNLIQNAAGCAIGGTATGNLVGVNPKLGPLAHNGGVTLTHALTSSSPAINAGNPTAPGSGGAACEAKDQRGANRPRGPRCDIGAYERSQ